MKHAATKPFAARASFLEGDDSDDGPSLRGHSIALFHVPEPGFYSAAQLCHCSSQSQAAVDPLVRSTRSLSFSPLILLASSLFTPFAKRESHDQLMA